MFKKYIKTIALFASTFFIFNAVQAQTRFVTDDFEIMLRTGTSVQNKIIKPLRSGTALTVLREDSGNGHSQVQTAKGEIGFVLSRFISAQPSAKSRLIQLQNELAELKANPTKIQDLMSKAQDENRLLIGQNIELTDQLQAIKSEMSTFKEVSGNIVDVATKNQRLESEVRDLLLQIEDMRIQNDTLKDNSENVRNLIGVGLVLLGLFLGWILSISGRRNRGSWGA